MRGSVSLAQIGIGPCSGRWSGFLASTGLDLAHFSHPNINGGLAVRPATARELVSASAEPAA
jgi:hypothetical protein